MSSAPSGARAPPPTPLDPTPTGSALDARSGARGPAMRGVARSALVGCLVDPFDKDAFEARVAQARASFDLSDSRVRAHAGAAALAALERATKAKGARPARAGSGGGGGGGSVQLVLGDEAFHLIGAACAGADAVVFEGDVTVEEDKLSIVAPILGLYAELYQHLHQMLQTTVFTMSFPLYINTVTCFQCFIDCL